MPTIPATFVAALKSDRRAAVDSTIDYLRSPPGRTPPEPLASLGRWFRQLPADDQAMVGAAMTFSAEGGLFGMLSLLDGVSSLEGLPGSYELYYVQGDARTRLNPPDGDYLHDHFNDLP